MSEVIEFQKWPKIARLFRDMVITEKIDGTNGAVIITEEGAVAAQSRNRLITPEDDNAGFAKWVDANQIELVAALGVGRHFGEWWGSGIQRRYGLTGNDKRFSLFNVNRYAETDLSHVPGLGLVPVLYEGPFDTRAAMLVLDRLDLNGSKAAPGFVRPEGIVIYHEAARSAFKVTVEHDEKPKGSSE